MASDEKIISIGDAKMFSARKTADVLGCAPDYVGRLCREGKLDGVLHRGAWFVDPASITRYEAEREAARTARAEALSVQRRNETLAFAYASKTPVGRAVAYAKQCLGITAAASVVIAAPKKATSWYYRFGRKSFLFAIAIFFALTAPLGAYVQRTFFTPPFVPAETKIVVLGATTTPPVASVVNNNTYPITQRTIEHTTAQDLSSFVTYDFLNQQVIRLEDSIATHGSGGGGITDFSSLTIADIPSLSGLYLSLSGGTVVGTTTLTGLALNTDCSAFNNGGKLTVDASGHVVCDNDTAGSGSGTPGGSTTQVQFNDAGDFGGDAGFTYNKTADRLTVTYASTTGFTSEYASTTSLVISGISTGLLKTVNGVVVAAIAGVDYLTAATTFAYPFPSNATTTLIAFNGGLTAPNATITYASTTAITATTASTTNLVVSGVANAILSTVNGAVGATVVSSPLTFSGSTLSISQATAGTSGYLSSSDFATFNNKISSSSLSAGAGISYNSSTGVIANTIAYPFVGNATTTQIAFNGGLTSTGAQLTNTTLASTTLTGAFVFANATGTNATTTNLAVSGTLTLGSVTGSTQCLHVNSLGVVSGTGADCGAGTGSFAYPFPSNATTTQIAFNGGITATGSTLASTTLTGNTVLANATSSNFSITSIVSALLKTTSGGSVVAATPGTDYVTVAGLSASYPFQGAGNSTSTLTQFNGGATFVGATTTALAVTGSSTVSSVLNVGGVINANGGVVGNVTGNVTGNAGTVTNGVYTTTFNSLFDTRFITDLAATSSIASITTLPNLSLPYSQLTGAPAIAGYPFALTGNATSTLTQFNGGLTAYASSTIGDGTETGGLTIDGNATTTGNAYFSGTVVAGNGTTPLFGSTLTIYQNGSNRAFALRSNSQKTIPGDQPLLFSLASNDANNPLELDVNQIGGSSQDVRGFNFQTTESGIANGGNLLLQRDGGKVGIGTGNPQTLLDVQGVASSSNLFVTNGATTTNLSATFASTTDLVISSAGGTGTRCLQVGADGTVSANASACGTGGSSFSYPFVGDATSTLLSFNGGITSYASSTIGNGTQTGGLTINGGATTTGDLAVVGNFTGAGLGSCSGTSNKLLWDNGQFSCGLDQTGGGGAGTDVNWTFFNNSGIEVSTTTNQVLIGAAATSTLAKLEVHGGANFDSATTTNFAITGLASKLLITNAGGTVGGATISAPLNLSGSTLSITQASGATNGYLSSSDFATFSNKISSSSLSAGAGISYNSSTGVIANTIAYPFVGNATTTQIAFNGGATFVGATTTALAVTGSSTISSILNVGGAINANGGVVGNLTGNADTVTNGVYTTTFNSLFDPRFITDLAATTSIASITTLPNLSLPYSQLTGAPAIAGYPFALTGNATSTLTQFNGGLTAFASSTIGNGTAGLTVSGSATTTGIAYFAGNVGIGTNAPNQALDITGAIAISGTTRITSGGKFDAANGSSNLPGITFAGDQDTGIYSAGTNSNVLGFSTNGVEVARFDPSGNFGIGTTSPYAKLSVGGDIVGTNIIATGTLQVAGNTTLANATSSNFSITSIVSALLKTTSGGSVVAATPGTDYVTVAGLSASYPFQGAGNSTSTLTQFNGGLTAYASSTITSLTTINSTSTNATTTNLAVVGTTNALLSTNASGAVVATSSLSISQYLTGTLPVANGGTGSTTLGGLLAGNGTSIYSAATGTVLSSNGITVTAGQSIIGSGLTITGTNAAADGTTHGVASFAASDFDASSGNITIDYINGQKAGASLAGFLSSADWSTFNNKISSTSLSATYPLAYNSATGVFTTAFGTTTTTGLTPNRFVYTDNSGVLQTAASSSLSLPNAALQNSSITVNGTAFNLGDSKTITAASSTLLSDSNTFGGTLNTFANAPKLATLSGVIYGNAGTLATQATSTETCTGPLSCTGFDVLSNGGAITITQATGAANGYLSSTDWSTFNNKISSTSLDTSAELASLITDETGSGALVFGTGASLSNTTLASTTLTGNTVLANATSSNFSITSIVSSLLKTTSGGSVVAATPGTDYVTVAGLSASYPFQGAGNSTSTLTQFNGGATFVGATTTALAVTGSSTVSSVLNVGGAINAASTLAISGIITSTATAANVLPYASTTALTVSGNLYGAGLSTCNLSTDKLLWSNGIFSCGTDLNTGGGSGAFSFGTNYGVLSAATSSPIWAQAGIFASSTSHFLSFDSINATSTYLSASIANFGGTGGTTTITSAGFVGIGSSTPSQKLTVAGGTILQTAFGNPTLAGSITSSNHTYQTAVMGHLAYMADLAGGLRIADVTDPRNPVVLSSTAYNGVSSAAVSIVVAGRYAYIGDSTLGLVIFDVSNPASPTQVSATHVATAPWSMALSGRYLYIADGDEQKLKIIDISDASAPAVVGTYVPGGSSQPYAVAVAGKYAYLGDIGNSKVYVVDISNPAAPAKTASYSGDGAIAPVGLSVLGRYLYVADAGEGFYSLDVKNANATPTAVGAYNPSGSYYKVAVAGTYGYLADNAGNVIVLDLSVQASPALVGSYATGGSPLNIALAGKYAYVSDNGGGLKILDINGASLPAATIGAVDTDTLNVGDEVHVGNNLYAGGSVNVGVSGIFSRGTISAYIASTTQTNPTVASFVGGNVGIGTTTPSAALSVAGNAYITGGATSTNLAITGIGAGLLKTLSSGAVVAAVVGTDYSNFSYPFALTGNATSTLTQFNGGLTAFASSTIGNGSATGGLTISGNATTTGNAYFAGLMGIGTTSPWANFSLQNNYGSVNTTLFAIASSTATNGSSALTLFSVDSTGITSVGNPAGTGDAAEQFANDANAWTVGYYSGDKSFRIASSTNLNSLPALTIQKNTLNVGIGTTSPASTLSVAGTIYSGSGGFKFPDGTTQTTAAGSSLTSTYTVDSGSASISVGDIVSYINGNVQKNSATVGSAYAANAVASTYTEAAALDSTHFVIVYIDNSSHGNAVIGTVSGTTITYGTPVVFSGASTLNYLGPAVAALDSTHFVVTYEDVNNSYRGTAVVGTVSGGNTISYGSKYFYSGTHEADYVTIAALDSTHFVAAYQDRGNGNLAVGVVGSVSGSVVTYGASTTLNSVQSYYTTVTALDSTHFAVAYSDNSNNKMAAVVSSVSGTTITPGTPVNLYSVFSYNLSAAALDSTHFVVGYSPTNGGAPNAVVSSVSGTTITAGTPVALSTNGTSYISASALDSTHFVVAYSGASNYTTTITSFVSGTSVSPGTPFVVNGVSSTFEAVAALDSTHFVTTYTGTSSYVYANALSTLIGNILGMATNAASAGGTVTVASNGVVTGLSGLTAGSTYYYSQSTGLTTTLQNYKVGIALSATSILLGSNNGAGGDQYFGDAIFANNFRITESGGLGSLLGLTFLNQLGHPILSLDEAGNVTMTGQFTGTISSTTAAAVGSVWGLGATTSAAELAASSTPARGRPWAGSFAHAGSQVAAALAALGHSIVHVVADTLYAANGVFTTLITQKLTADVVYADQINTKAVCIGATCIGEDELKALLNGEAPGLGTPSPEPGDTTATGTPPVPDTASTTPPDDTGTASTTPPAAPDTASTTPPDPVADPVDPAATSTTP